MRGIDPQAVSATFPDSLRVVSETFDEDYFRRFFAPGDFTLDTAIVPAVSERLSSIEMADGVTSQAKANFRCRFGWYGAGARLTVWYSSLAAGTANFSLLAGVRYWKTGDVVTALPDIGSGAIINAAPGPAVASTLLETSYVWPKPAIPSNASDLSLRIARLGGGDPNNNALRIYAALFEVLPR